MAMLQSFGTTRDLFFVGNADSLRKHICPPTIGGGPIDDVRTRGIVVDRFFHRDLLNTFELPLPLSVQERTGVPGGLPMWVLGDPEASQNRNQFPGPMIRVVQGDIVHALTSSRTGTHTIHWHGIEPTPMNDGVGKHSFEITGNFVYQFQPNAAGTYFYHCHKNTVLHFEMGLFGLLVVDPAPPTGAGISAPYMSAPGFVAGRLTTDPVDTEVSRYDIEKIWVADDFDSRWHFPEPSHNHNMQECSSGDPFAPETFHVAGTTQFDMHIFRPDIFNITGVVVDYGQSGPPFTPVFTGTVTDPSIAINAVVGQKILLRFLNASYTIQHLMLPVEATVVAFDGHPLGVGPAHKYSRPYLVPANTPIRLTTAQRHDIIIEAKTPISANARIDYYDWIKGVPGGLIATVFVPVNIA